MSDKLEEIKKSLEYSIKTEPIMKMRYLDNFSVSDVEWLIEQAEYYKEACGLNIKQAKDICDLMQELAEKAKRIEELETEVKEAADIVNQTFYEDQDKGIPY